jgi:acyl transferase domain-containing protein/NADPH:quinone reductase-like Zn-dependent oxidoreductase
MAGLAGVIKATLSLENAVLPGLVGFEKLNPKLLLQDWKLALPLETMPWPVKGLRRASVNSFGFGGANAHVILDDVYHYLESHGLRGRHRTIKSPASPKSNNQTETARSEPTSDHDYQLLPFSTHDLGGLDRLSKTLAGYLATDPATGKPPEIDMADLAFTLATHRSQFSFRSYAVSRSVQDLASKDVQEISNNKQKRRGQPENVIFVFTGQGAQWPLMGQELLKQPVFRASVVKSQGYLDELGCRWSAADLLRDPSTRINIAEHCQPICTVLQVALVDLLASWGVTAKATVGHSSGEIAAAYAAGGINHKDAVKIAYMRGYYCGQIQPRLKEKRGAMLAAGLTVQEAQQYLELVAEGSVVIGCVNSPASVTLSGDYDGISYLEQRIKLDGKFSRKLRVEVAYHSPHMDTVSQDFLESLGTIQTSPTFTASMFSSVTTEKLDTPDELNATYWVTNMVSAVRFSDAVNTLLSHSEVTARSKRKAPVNWLAAIELGPHEALKGPFNQCASAVGAQRRQASIPYTSLVRRGEPADKTAAQAAGLLWALGYPVDIPSVNNVDESRKKTLQTLTCLPPYPWQHSKGFWHEPIASVSTRLSTFPRTDLLGVAVENQNPHEAQWKNVLRLSENPWMRDHTITGTVLYPAAGMLIMAFEGALQMAATKQLPVLGIEFHDVQFDRGLVVPDNDDGVETLLSLRSHETLESWFHWAVYSQPTGGRWTKHSFGLLAIVEGADDATNPRWRSEGERLASVKARSTRSIDPDGFYHQLESIGMGYGPCFTNLTAAGAIDGEQTGHGVVAIPDTKSTMPFHFEYPHVIHPATLDAIFHLIFVALFEGQPMIEAAIPVTVERLFISADQPAGTGAEFVGISNGRKINERDSSGSLVVSDSNWSSVKITVTNMVVRKVSSPSATIDISTGESMVDTLPKRVGEMRWMEDLDLLDLETTNKVVEQTAEKLSGLAPHVKLASAWLSHTCHKYANLHACAVADSLLAADSVAEFVSQFAPAPPYESCLSKVLVIATSDDVHHYLADRLRHKATTASYDLITPDGFKTMFQNEAIKPFDIVLVHCTEQRPLDESLLGWGSHVKTSGKILVLGGRTTEVQSLQDLGFGMIMASVARTDVSFLVAGRSPTEVRRRENATIYVLQSPKCSSKVIRFRQLLDQAFAIDNITLVTKQLGEIKTLVGQTVISLLEIEEPLVICWTEEQFQHFCDLVSSQSYVLWVTRGGALEKGERSLQFAPTTGLLRTIRTEMPQVSLPHLDLSPSLNLEDVSASNMIRTVFDATALESEGIETEFVELSGTLFIPRVVSNVSLDGELNAHSENPSPVPALLSSEQENPLRLAGAESLDSLNQSYWTADSKVGLAIGDDEVEIKTESVALESTHLSTKSTSQNALNLRAASGIVTRLGADVHQFAIGDHVFFPLFQHETLRTRMNQQKQLLRKLPAGIRVDVVLLLSTSLMAAYHSLHNVARVAAGESVLIHLQNGELAQAALHIAKKAGTKVFMAVSSASERDTFMHRYHVAQHRIFDHASNGTNMIQTLMDATSGRGFDVIVSDHRGESRRQSTSCIAESGRFVDLSRNMRISDMNGDFFERNASISSVDLWSLSQPKLESVFAAASAILHQDAFLDLHSTAPQFTVADLQSASAYLDQTANATATVYFDNDALIPIIPVKPASPDLSPKATYIIAGGLGALGLTIAENMVTHGARHLVLLSRSGITNTRQQTSVDELRQRGCVVDTLPCDVTDEDQVKSLVELGQNRGWSVKGLIQCAMVLRVSEDIFKV